jgi:hypothetical protein
MKFKILFIKKIVNLKYRHQNVVIQIVTRRRFGHD